MLDILDIEETFKLMGNDVWETFYLSVKRRALTVSDGTENILSDIKFYFSTKIGRKKY